MKRNSLLIVFLLSAFLGFSQEMKVHTTDGNITVFNLSDIDSITFSTSTGNGAIPLDFNNWLAFTINGNAWEYTQPSTGVFEMVTEGLKIYGTGYREGLGIHPTPLNNYLINQSTIYVKWKANGGGNFMGVFPSLLTDTISWTSTTYLTNLTTHHSYNNSYLITDDEWYFTRIFVNDPFEVVAITATGNYDNFGGAIVQSNIHPWDNEYKYFYFSIVDCYASSSAYAIVGEVRMESNTVIPTNGLKAFYPFNGNANDESGNGNNGTVSGPALTSDRFGNPNRAYNFNGGSDQINTTCPGVLGSQPRTFSMWTRKNSSTTACIIELGHGLSTPSGNWYIKTYYGNDKIYVVLDVNNGYVSYVANNNDNEWHHYVWLVPDIPNCTLGDVKIYEDGVLLTTIDAELNLQNVINTGQGDNVSLAKYLSSIGNADDIRIYNRALSESEIQELFHEGGW